jgi:hypothetical protein
MNTTLPDPCSFVFGRSYEEVEAHTADYVS